MLRKVLHNKIHQAAVTGRQVDYNGSIVIDRAILREVGLRASDAVVVANCRSGSRFETYVFPGEAGSGIIEVRGAAAHLVEIGDRVIILHYAFMDEREYAAHRPKVALMNANNTIDKVIRYEPEDPSAR